MKSDCLPRAKKLPKLRTSHSNVRKRRFAGEGSITSRWWCIIGRWPFWTDRAAGNGGGPTTQEGPPLEQVDVVAHPRRPRPRPGFRPPRPRSPVTPVGARTASLPPLGVGGEPDRRLGDPERLGGDRPPVLPVHPGAPLRRMLAVSKRRPRSVSPCRRRAAKSAEQPTSTSRPAPAPASTSSIRRVFPLPAAPGPPPLHLHAQSRDARLQDVEVEVGRHRAGALAEEGAGAGRGAGGQPRRGWAHDLDPVSARARGAAGAEGIGPATTAPVGQARAQAPQPTQRSASKTTARKVTTRSGTRIGPLGA